MKSYYKLIVLLVSIIAVYSIANAMDIVVNVKWQWLTIWTPANITLGNFSSSTQKEFSDYFWIDDLRGSKTGHYTSIQWVVYWSDGEIVSGATVAFRTNSENIILVWGIEDNTDFNRNLTSSSYVDITNPTLLFYRNNNPNHPWYYSKYWFKPSIKVTVPNWSASPYTVKLSYTLYDMPRDIIAQ